MIPHQIQSFEAYQKAYTQSIENPESFWENIAQHFFWQKKWDKVLEWEFATPNVKWFLGAKLNITENCLDRHLQTQPHKVAFIFEPNNPEQPAQHITYLELHQRVCHLSNVLKANGIQKGGRVCIYLPMTPDLAIAVLACARVGAIHSVVFGGFSAVSVANRLNDATCKMVITADGAYRGNKIIFLKQVIDEALQNNQCPSVETVLVLKHTNNEVYMHPTRDKWLYHELQKIDPTLPCSATIMDAEDELFILYTSGSTGKPKGVVHSGAGYMVYAYYSFVNVFQYEPNDIYFCTADIGWITGHSYIVYAPLLAGATTVIFEGIPTYPTPARFWQVIEKHKVTIFYTAPTAIRSLMQAGVEHTQGHNLNSLRVLGSVGEPINEEAWHWYSTHIGNGKCPIVDTWWQTETGGILISPLANLTPLLPAYATLPLPGIQPVIVDANGNEIKGNPASGNLCIRFPWPSIIRTTYNDHERCYQNYFATYPHLYFTGDGCLRNEQGYYRITGRVDDVLNVSGHRIGTAELENAINLHSQVVESAVVGYPHSIKGQGIFAYIICKQPPAEIQNREALKKEIIETVLKNIGAIAKPDQIVIVQGLPKTRSGKIMRRILRKIAENDLANIGDTSTLLDAAVVEHIQQVVAEQAT